MLSPLLMLLLILLLLILLLLLLRHINKFDLFCVGVFLCEIVVWHIYLINFWQTTDKKLTDNLKLTAATTTVTTTRVTTTMTGDNNKQTRPKTMLTSFWAWGVRDLMRDRDGNSCNYASDVTRDVRRHTTIRQQQRQQNRNGYKTAEKECRKNAIKQLKCHC